MNKIEFGATFSQRELRYKGIDIDQAMLEYRSLGLTWIRLACYWSDIEKEPREFDFAEIDQIVKFCEGNEIKIIMCLGMKGPCWPEFYLPPYKTNLLKTNPITPEHNRQLLENVVRFNLECVKHFQKSPATLVWHIENEGLDPSGPQSLSISPSFLAEEIKAIRRTDKRKILISLWANELLQRGNFTEAIRLADIVGLDIYPKVPQSLILGLMRYTGLNSKEIEYVARLVKHSGKELWITELQTEPWEVSDQARNLTNPPSFSPNDFDPNTKYALSLGPKVNLFWGFEFWLWRKLQGDNRYMEKAKEVVNKYS